MSNEFLSQDEVDALLKGVADDGEPDEAAGGVRPFRLGQQVHVLRDPMPALDGIHDRFVRALPPAVFGLVRRSPEVTAAPVKVVKYAEFVSDLATPANLNVVTVEPLRGHALVVLDPPLVSHVVDAMFGGAGRLPSRTDARALTPTEQRIVERLLAIVLDEYRKAWSHVHPVRFEHARTETHPQFAAVAAPDDPVVVATFTVALGGHGGAFHVCVPYATLAPIRDLLDRSATGDRPEPDGRFSQRLRRRLQEAEVELVAKLATAEVRVADLLALKAGDVLPIELASTIEAHVDGVPVLACGYGELNGRYALRVERLLRHDDASHGDLHA
jgi:flagellar motor switch protein FliM